MLIEIQAGVQSELSDVLSPTPTSNRRLDEVIVECIVSSQIRTPPSLLTIGFQQITIQVCQLVCKFRDGSYLRRNNQFYPYFPQCQILLPAMSSFTIIAYLNDIKHIERQNHS